MLYLQCSNFGARLRKRVFRGKFVPQRENDFAASETLNAISSHPIVTSPRAVSEVDQLREAKTPEALNQDVEEFVAYESQKIKALGQTQNDLMAEELMARGATIDEISKWNI
ncbi:hypothetical protein CHS0354_000100 [Potamilus streckersoni]|uniref:Uncharacterized protein n=1 Tax=Potamilus streckersoni TaxID=2493646 RepID=A0AAE0TK98_9BIVA|nr:hypothetical protein CHS0354_000100 [Potamilus streckersoni]